MKQDKTILVMAGGTGGHVFPGLAVADKLKAQGWQVSWLGTRNRMEAKLVPDFGYEIDFIDIAGVRGNGLKALLQAPFRVVKSILQARRVLKKRHISLVLGMGGFASGPGGVAAWTLGIPVLLHEQNAAAGLTNRILSVFAKKVLMGFSGAFIGEKAILVGNPVREQLLCLPQKKISSASSPLNVLIIGGSLGAQVFNQLLPKVLSRLDPAQFKVRHQSGRGNDKDLQRAYQALDLEVDVKPFISDMGEAYSWADLVICRAGALTVAEVAVVGLPAIFVPLPHATDDHQTKNAQNLLNKEAALLIPQNELTEEKLSDYLLRLSQNRARLDIMAKNSKKAAIIDATDRVVSICNQFVKSNNKKN